MKLFHDLINKKAKLAVIGLGYVGMPIAVAFARKGLEVIGFDVNERRPSATAWRKAKRGMNAVSDS